LGARTVVSASTGAPTAAKDSSSARRVAASSAADSRSGKSRTNTAAISDVSSGRPSL
jgi:hypothetical protein